MSARAVDRKEVSMKRQSVVYSMLIALAVVMCFTGTVAAQGDFCDMAPRMLKKAALAFKKDKKEGLKLFIKATELCDSKQTNYNLGVAYYSYGDTANAEISLRKAVGDDCRNPVWLNNLASVILDNQKNPAEAAGYAEKAVRLNNKFFPAIETLTHARFAAGQYLSALKTIDQAVKKNPSVSSLKQTEQKIISDFCTHYLALIKSGQVEQGLKGLEQGDFKEKPAEVLCRVLGRLDRLDQGIAKASTYQARFNSTVFGTIREELISRKIQQFYALFKTGKVKQAVLLSRKFSEKHPQSLAARKASDELFNAMMDDVTGIQVPEAVASAPSNSPEDRGVDKLIGSIGSAAAPAQQEIDLSIDVETNIPKARRKNPNAVALLIGNQRYSAQRKGLPDVTYAERDVAVMEQYLITAMGYDKTNIIKVSNATSGDFRTLFGSPASPEGKLHRYIRPDGSSDVFVYYVGHGSPGPQGKSAYLVPVDATADYIQNNGYPLDLFYQIMEAIPAQSKTIVLDACFSGESAGGNLFKNISPAMLKTTAPVKTMSQAALFCAADKDQVATWYPAKRHSLFSYFFFKGIQGAADTNNDKIIHLSELQAYLQSEVKYRAGRESNRTQTPLVMGKQNFVIAELR